MLSDLAIYTCTAGHCNILQHTATYCNALQHTATHCNTLQHTATHCNTLHYTATHCNTLQHTDCNTMHHAAPHCTRMQHTLGVCTLVTPCLCTRASNPAQGGCYFCSARSQYIRFDSRIRLEDSTVVELGEPRKLSRGVDTPSV